MAAPQPAALPLELPPITAASFLPPMVACPRAWQRVPVVPVASRGPQRRIWKRVAASLVVVDEKYRRAAAELQSQGECPRKRARRERHVTVWGDAEWDVRVDQPRDGTQDLLAARDAVAVTQELPNSTELANGCPRHATFLEDALRWVPRKRHNTRWPIEPKTASTRMVAALQPLIEFEVPSATEPEDATHRIDDKKLERRSTRRLSRRVSLFPADMSPQKVSLITLTPARPSQTTISPVKRSPALAPRSPVRVAESPLRSFRVNATPVKVVLESPKASLPHESPSKSSPAPATPASKPASIKGATGPDLTRRVSDPPLVFDQPIHDNSSEPQYETRRRHSLQAARRSDRRLSGPLRMFSLESVKEAPNRRHSFALITTPSADAKERRRTLDAFFSATEGALEDLLPQMTKDAPIGDKDSDAASASCVVFKIDAGTNLDIFGPGQKLSDGSSPVQPSPLKAVQHSPLKSAEPDDLVAQEAGDEVAASPVRNVLGVTYAASDGGSDVGQAATDPSPNVVDAEQHTLTSDFTSNPTSDEPSTPFDEEEDFAFKARDPEGLSTIYEEESVVMEDDADFAPTSTSPPIGHEGESIMASSSGAANQAISEQAANVTAENKKFECSSPTSTPTPSSSRSVAQMDGSPQLMHTDCKADSRALADHAPEVTSNERHAGDASTNHVVTDVDVLFKPDSPDPVHEFTPGTSSLLRPDDMGNDVSSPSSEEESVATPENDFCMTTFDIETKKSDQHTAEMGSSQSTLSGDDDVLCGDSTSDPTQTPLSASRCLLSKQPSTPSQDLASPPPGVDGEGDALMETSDDRESSGFTPINGRQISPPSRAVGVEEGEGPDSEAEPGEGEDMMEDELTEAIDEDFTLTVVAPRLENDTLTLQASHDDSETEMLRKFVTRVAADKNAKAAAAAAALAKKPARPKRRSGSTGSTASSTGSPIAKSDTPHKRTPLGEKNANSPSPVKKRKHGDELEKDEAEVLEVCEVVADAPKIKRRKKRTDPVLATFESLDSPASTEGGPRRSTRSRNSRVALKPVAPSANSIALSLIPVRLPGMGVMDDSTMDMQLMMAKSRSEEKDVAAVTRVNTRKNKANAVHPKLVLARQAEDPAGWRMRELKMVFEAKESRAAEANADAAADGRKSRKAKGVRWAEELVRFQGDEAPSAFKAMASSLLADIMDEEEDELAITQPERAPEPVQPEVVERPPSTPAKKALPRRTRSSRLLAPKPVDKIAEKPAASPAPPVRSTSLSKIVPPTITAAVPASSSSSGTKAAMGTRRSKIAKLGMGVNGTPAPKRRGRPAMS
ncbi:hypothetical protein B0T16DRAFT_126546 [Cercophora newfieldiana]|uniref:Uncharacterized protein n=1 Tax=Cercophora newfieldiana TaxID=92897 RepID=A0AA39YAR2_9PEZI|nr:hypothetical protein B0T16DRAFT_126546 [Cercophora newfieldiana]